MTTILYLGIDKRSAEFAEAVVGKAARDETVYIFGADCHRSDEINRYGLTDIPCIARIATVTTVDEEGNEHARTYAVYQTSDPDKLATFKLDADEACAAVGAE